MSKLIGCTVSVIVSSNCVLVVYLSHFTSYVVYKLSAVPLRIVYSVHQCVAMCVWAFPLPGPLLSVAMAWFRFFISYIVVKLFLV